MKTNDSSHYSPINPTLGNPYHNTKGGSDILEVVFFCEGEIVSEYEDKKCLPYSFLEVGPSSVEITMVKPEVTNCFAIEEDIHTALRKQFGRDYTLNFTK